ncbi:MAG TPA: chemotaxis protein CheR [Alphaproteobacteria bacterium]|jgi:chemotaxis protein methyltransferase CheR|nr:chemotaxis protein CheR [Alphaproteobacteria bacterium]
MKPGEFEYLASFLKGRSGLILNADKMYLVESRLQPVARKHDLPGLSELIWELRLGRDQKLTQDIMEAMTTNETFFFRDKTPYDTLRNELIPFFQKARSTKQLRIWSAAASTGQEPYSIAMILKEMSAALQGWRTDIIATDISREVLEKSRAGMYSQFEVQRGLPIQMLVKYFKQIGEMWQIDSGIRAMVQFKEGNLLANFDGLGSFDIIFCRNVLIYFDQETKKDVLERMARLLPEEGVLILGAAETVLGLTNTLKVVKGLRGVYCKNSEAVTARVQASAMRAPKPLSVAG